MNRKNLKKILLVATIGMLALSAMPIIYAKQPSTITRPIED
jgi:hypothetical protein